MRRFDKYFAGLDGHVSWTAVGVFVSTVWFFVVHITIYVLLFVLEKDVSEGALNWSLASSAQLFGSLVIRGVQGFAKHWGTDFFNNVGGDGSVSESSKKNKPEIKSENKTTKAPQIKRTVKTQQAQFIKPCQGRVTSLFRTKDRPTHHGIDIAQKGNVPILAAADGKVVRSYYSKTYGNTVILSHSFGGEEWQTLYAHLDGLGAAQGTEGKQGDVIGKMGNTGRSSGQHLHFEIHRGAWNAKKSNAVDPMKWIS